MLRPLLYTRRYIAASRGSRWTTSRLIRCDTIQPAMGVSWRAVVADGLVTRLILLPAGTTTRVTRTTNDSQLPAYMRAEVKARGNTGAECIE